MLHRDISANNVMFEIRDGAVKFIVIDFDLATMVDSNGEPLAAPSAKHRTGTLPFMAYELLDDMSRLRTPGHRRIVHRLRHDFESLFYLCLYCILTMVEVEDAKIKADTLAQLKDWEDMALHGIASLKLCLCTDVKRINEHLVFPPSCEVLRRWFIGWVYVFDNALTAVKTYDKSQLMAEPHRTLATQNFDIDTLQGTITRDTIKLSLRSYYEHPLRPEDLLVANIPGLGKDVEAYMHDDEDMEGQNRHFQKQGGVAEKATPTRKPKSTAKAKKVEVAQKKAVPKATVASTKITTATLVSPVRKQIPKQAVAPKRAARTLAAAARSMTTRSMRKGAK